MCESPRGPVGPDAAPVAPGTANSNFKTQVHAAIFVIDLATNQEIPAQGLLLTREFDRLYTRQGTPDDACRRLPLIPNDIMFAAGTTFAYVSWYGSDAVFRIAYKADGSLERVGAAAQPFINLKPGGGNVAAGELPIGIASANAGAATVPFARGPQREQPQPVGAHLRHPDRDRRGAPPPIPPLPAPRPRATGARSSSSPAWAAGR